MGWSLYHIVKNGEIVPQLVYKTKASRGLEDIKKYPKFKKRVIKILEKWLSDHDMIAQQEKKPNPFHIRASKAAENALNILKKE